MTLLKEWRKNRPRRIRDFIKHWKKKVADAKEAVDDLNIQVREVAQELAPQNSETVIVRKPKQPLPLTLEKETHYIV